MKFTTITCTVVKRIERERSQSIRIAKVFGYHYDEVTGSSTYVKFKDCWLPFEWYTKKNKRQQLMFREVNPEEVQVYNPVTKEPEVHIKRFQFQVPEWLQKNLKQEVVSKQAKIEFSNDDNPITIIEEQSADYTQSSDERTLDMRGLQTQMFDSPINISQEIVEEFDSLSYGIS